VRLPERGDVVLPLRNNTAIETHGPLPNVWSIKVFGDAGQGDELTALIARDPSGAGVGLVFSRTDHTVTPIWTTPIFE
jgi:hypothetical protein